MGIKKIETQKRWNLKASKQKFAAQLVEINLYY